MTDIFNRKIFDISPMISSNIAVFPGDTPFSLKTHLSFENGNNLTLGSINSTTHLGAHADAPIHYHPNGESIDQRDLQLYIGEAQVIEVKTKKGERIKIEDLCSPVSSKRVLFKTNSFPNPDNWNNDFCSLSPELVENLSQSDVLLVGIDTPSIDPYDDKELKTHNKVFEKNFAVLEGLDLSNICSGNYYLIALPLKIKGGDSSPVRAILMEL